MPLNRRPKLRSSHLGLTGLLSLSLVLAACSGGSSPSPSASTQASVAPSTTAASQSAAASASTAPEIGAPEKTKLTVGYQLGDVGSSAPFWIAKAQGYYQAEGLEVEPVKVDEVQAAVVGGSLDIGLGEATPLVDAATKGVPLMGVCGWRWEQPLIIGVGKGINTVQDLAGKDIVLGLEAGDPATEHRVAALKEKAGWDLSTVKVNFVNPPGFTNQFVQLLIGGKIAMSYMFPRHVKPVEDAGGKIVVNFLDHEMSDLLVATKSWIADNPNTLARFLRATIKGKQFLINPDNAAKVQEIMAAGSGIEITDSIKQNWEAEYNTHTTDCSIPAESMSNAITNSKLTDPGRDKYIDPTALKLAQESLGIKVNVDGEPQPLSTTPLP